MAKPAKSTPKDSIMIGGVSFEIQVVPALKDGSTELHGETDTNTHIIKINGDDTLAKQGQTLFHECIHAALHITGQSVPMTPEQEEGLVLALDYMLWPIVPELLRRTGHVVSPSTITQAGAN